MCIVTNIQNSDKLKHRLKSKTKHAESRIVFIIVDPVTAMTILSSADDSVMGGAGYAWLLS